MEFAGAGPEKKFPAASLIILLPQKAKCMAAFAGPPFAWLAHCSHMVANSAEFNYCHADHHRFFLIAAIEVRAAFAISQQIGSGNERTGTKTAFDTYRCFNPWGIIQPGANLQPDAATGKA
jgi:hypothetical protein